MLPCLSLIMTNDIQDWKGPRKMGLYQNRIIQMLANKVYFKNANDDGIVLEKMYSPFPIVGLALILAAVSHIHIHLLIVGTVMFILYG